LALQWAGRGLYLALAVKMICTTPGKYHTPLGWVVGVRWRAKKFIKGAGLVVLGPAFSAGLRNTYTGTFDTAVFWEAVGFPDGWVCGQPCATIRDAGCVGRRGREWVGAGAI